MGGWVGSVLLTCMAVLLAFYGIDDRQHQSSLRLLLRPGTSGERGGVEPPPHKQPGKVEVVPTVYQAWVADGSMEGVWPGCDKPRLRRLLHL
jgi:hypothetical protein